MGQLVEFLARPRIPDPVGPVGTAREQPAAIRRDLDLHRPIFQKTAAYGHFGREDRDFTWERTDRADELRRAAGLETGDPARVS